MRPEFHGTGDCTERSAKHLATIDQSYCVSSCRRGLIRTLLVVIDLVEISITDTGVPRAAGGVNDKITNMP
jgi:hypothetical protein